MSSPISLQQAERRVVQATYRDGLWDVFLGSFFALFALAPLLSEPLGDFWSSVVFLPFWALVYLAIRLLRQHVVAPRVGSVKFGPARRAKLARFTVVMLAVNSAAVLLGLVVALGWVDLPGGAFGIGSGLILLIGLSLAAYLLDFSRLYVYGLLAGLARPLGEWLWTQGYASHHGFPLTFGILAAIIVVVGLALFLHLLLVNPLPPTGIPSGDA